MILRVYDRKSLPVRFGLGFRDSVVDYKGLYDGLRGPPEGTRSPVKASLHSQASGNPSHG